MVEFVLIRLAEIRDEAAQEEWDKAHPCQAALRKRLRWLRIKTMLAVKWAAATPPALRFRRKAADCHAWLQAQYVAAALVATRRLGVPLPRAVGEQLPIKALLMELELRGGDPASCVERSDLMNALCGPPPPPPQGRSRTQSFADCSFEDRDDNV